MFLNRRDSTYSPPVIISIAAVVFTGTILIILLALNLASGRKISCFRSHEREDPEYIAMEMQDGTLQYREARPTDDGNAEHASNALHLDGLQTNGSESLRPDERQSFNTQHSESCPSDPHARGHQHVTAGPASSVEDRRS